MDGILRGLRPYTSNDLPALKQLLTVAHTWPPTPTRGSSTDDILRRWKRRNVNPETDVSVIGGPDGTLLAYFQAARWGQNFGRITFEIAVQPAYRCRGIGGALYRLVEERARELGAIQVTAPVYYTPEEQKPEVTGFLLRRGFFIDSSYWQMRIDSLTAISSPTWPQGVGMRTYTNSAQDAARWAHLIRECFNEPATGEGIKAQAVEEGSSPEGYFFAVDTATGEEIGTTRARIDEFSGGPAGYVGTVGVLPRYRGRGIAQALVRHTLAYLSARGMSTATLFVENKNTSARDLYARMGWRDVYRTDHYWKNFSRYEKNQEL